MKSLNMLMVGLLILPLYGDLSISQMENMIEKIKEKRVSTLNINATIDSSPFVLLKKEQNITIIVNEKPVEKNITFILGGIVNNRAFLNSDWVTVGSKIDGYILYKIENRGVTLKKGNKTIQVFLRRSKQILKMNEG